jgi:hypothetical protein
MARRLVRAKHKIKAARIPYRVPADHELPGRLRPVLAVVYLVYTAGLTNSTDPGLCAGAIRLARILAALLPDEPAVAGLLALLLTDSRRPSTPYMPPPWRPPTPNGTSSAMVAGPRTEPTGDVEQVADKVAAGAFWVCVVSDLFDRHVGWVATLDSSVGHGLFTGTYPSSHSARLLVTAHVAQAGKGATMQLAYLDANSGSLLIQAIVAGAAGVAVFFKFGWRRITAPFRSRRPRS